MIIAYRRMSGKVALSHFDKGQRGLWFEKRLAFLRWLRGRGHTVEFVDQRMTDHSQQPIEHSYDPKRHELLVVEFGSSNKQFYGPDLAITLEIAHRHKGPAVYLCDDPDLPFLWRDFQGQGSQWRVWMNATRPGPIGAQPRDTVTLDFPFASLVAVTAQPSSNYAHTFVYNGRCQGREKVFRALLEADLPITIAGRAKEWAALGVALSLCEPPDQPLRATWYAGFMGSLVVADAKHKRLGFRTGRAFHALCAGTPFVAEADHPGFVNYHRFTTPASLKEYAVMLAHPQQRLWTWTQQANTFAADLEIADHRAKELGI